MNPEKNDHIRIKKTTLIIVVLLLLAGLFGWWRGRSNEPSNNSQQSPSSSNTNTPPAEDSSSEAEVKSIVRYTLPDGWKEAVCPASKGSVFVIPSGADAVNCDANPSAPVKISIDTANNKDCNDLQGVQNVSKHICVSEFINGRKSLKAETRYNQQSSYKTDTTIHAYYIDTGKEVVKLEYFYTSDNKYQAGFDQLAKSVQVK